MSQLRRLVAAASTTGGVPARRPGPSHGGDRTRARGAVERSRVQRARSQEGFTLIEVIISAFMVGLIVVGTFTGFQVADQSSAQDRLQNEAAVLAAQSQDQLRSAPASALEALAASPHTFTKTVEGVAFTIKQEAHYVGVEGSGSCSVTEHKSTINALRITSVVSWSHTVTNSKPVVETGVVTPPTGSAVEVDVGNAPAPTAGVQGVTVVVKYTPAGSESPVRLEGVTPNEGCLVFGAIPATAATVEIPEQVGFVTPSGGQYIEPKEAVLAPNRTTYVPVTYQRGSAIIANFTYKESSKYTHPNNKGESESEEVASDTFVAYSSAMEESPKYEVGSTRGNFISTGDLYEPIPGSPVIAPTPEPYKAQATSPQSTDYPQGNLFPFPENDGEGAWEAYAGDCSANDPETLKVPGVKLKRKWLANPGAPATEFPEVPLSHIQLNVYKGTEGEVGKLGANAAEDLETTHAHLVTVTNVSCQSATPNPVNETAIKTEHTQETTTETSHKNYGGHLKFPFQPFGAYTLCVYNAETSKTYTVTGEDLTVAGTTQSIYLAQRSEEEEQGLAATEEANEKAAETKRKTEEAQTKTQREKEEAPAREKREKEEAAEKTAREKEEAAKTKWESEEASQKAAKEKEANEKTSREKTEESERTQWAKEEATQEKKGKHLKPTQKEKEASQKKTRETKEAEEKTAQEKRKKEEEATAATRKKEEEAAVTRKKEEEATAAVRKKEEETRAAAVKKEEELAATRKKEEETKKSERVAREAAEAKEGKGVKVESKKTGCP